MNHSILHYLIRALVFVPIAAAIVLGASILAPLYVLVLIVAKLTGHNVSFACKRMAR